MKKKRNSHSKHIALIEHHLRQYKQYIVGIKNLQLQLDHIMPNMTASYELNEGSRGCFVVSSTTERAALDRIESKKALDINEKISEYNLIVRSIEAALAELEPAQQDLIRLRYFEGNSIEEVARIMGYTHKNIYRIRHRIMERLIISLWNILTL